MELIKIFVASRMSYSYVCQEFQIMQYLGYFEYFNETLDVKAENQIACSMQFYLVQHMAKSHVGLFGTMWICLGRTTFVFQSYGMDQYLEYKERLSKHRSILM